MPREETHTPPLGGESSSQVKILTGRPSNACIRCKSRKIKCTYEYPACSACKKSMVDCEYPGSDKPNWDYVRQLENRLKALEDSFHDSPSSTSSAPAPAPKRRRKDVSTTFTGVGYKSPRSSEAFRFGPPSSVQALDRLPSAVDLVGLVDDPRHLEPPDSRGANRVGDQGGQEDGAVGEEDEGGGKEEEEWDLPDGKIMDQAVDWFFDQVNPTYPIFHEGMFRKQVGSLRPSGTGVRGGGRVRSKVESSAQTVHAIYVILALHAWKKDNQRSSGKDTKKEAKDHWETSLTYVRAAWSGNRLGRLQGILLQLQYIFRDPEAGDIWDLVGRAVRIAVELGLHHDPHASARSTFTPLEVDLRRRLFWTTYSCDRIVSVALGRPTSLHHDWISTQFASLVSDDLITETSIASGLIDHRKEAGVHHAKFRILQWDIYDRLCTVKSSNSPAPSSEWFDSIQQRLQEWRTGYPCTPGEYMTDDWLEMHYNLLQSLLYRPNTGNAQPTFDQLIKAIQAASNVVRTYKRLWRLGRLHFVWLGVHHVFMAGVTYLNSLWIANMKGWNIVRSYVEAILDIQTCSQVLEAMSASQRGTDRMRDAFETVSAAVVGHLASQVLPQQTQDHHVGTNTNPNMDLNTDTVGGMGSAMVEMNVNTPFDISALFATPTGISPIDVVDQVSRLQPPINHPIQSSSMQSTRSQSQEVSYTQQGMAQTTGFTAMPDLWSLPYSTTPEERVTQPKTAPNQNERWSISNALSSARGKTTTSVADDVSTTHQQFQPDPNPAALFPSAADPLTDYTTQHPSQEGRGKESESTKQATSSTLQQSTFDTIENFFSNPFSELASVEGLTCSIGAFLNDTRSTKQAEKI